MTSSAFDFNDFVKNDTVIEVDEIKKRVIEYFKRSSTAAASDTIANFFRKHEENSDLDINYAISDALISFISVKLLVILVKTGVVNHITSSRTTRHSPPRDLLNKSNNQSTVNTYFKKYLNEGVTLSNGNDSVRALKCIEKDGIVFIVEKEHTRWFGSDKWHDDTHTITINYRIFGLMELIISENFDLFYNLTNELVENPSSAKATSLSKL